MLPTWDSCPLRGLLGREMIKFLLDLTEYILRSRDILRVNNLNQYRNNYGAK